MIGIPSLFKNRDKITFMVIKDNIIPMVPDTHE